MRRARAAASLKARALRLLAQRDRSRVELRRRLLRVVEEARNAEGADADAVDGDAAAARVDALLDWLEQHGYLSDARFVESRVHARAERFGTSRIKSELAQHGLALPATSAEALAASELERAAAVRARRFAEPPHDAREHAAQARFLAGRGFAPELIRRLLRRVSREGVQEDSLVR